MANKLFGWGGTDKGLLKEAQQEFPFPELQLKGHFRGGRLMMFDIYEKAFGSFPRNIAQLIGDCVGQGAKGGVEYLQTYEIYEKGEAGTFKYVYAPYLYGCGRVFVGGGRLGGDGSLGVWQAQALGEYGAIAEDTEGLPQYSAKVARAWGARPGPPQNYVEIGKQHRLSYDFAAAKVRTWDQAVAAILNGYPVTVASTVGFEMKPRSDGFHYQAENWPHQMVAVGIDDEDGYVAIRNSWGDGENVHGFLTDFKTGKRWPGGFLRVKKATFERMLEMDDSFALSNFGNFEAREIDLDRNWFNWI